jgi:hypothetical protein
VGRVAVVVGIFAAIGVAVWAYAASREPAPMTGVVVARGKAALDVSDQQLVAGEVRMDRVLAPADSWVVVTSESATGSAPIPVGMTHVTAGETRDLRVALEPGTDPAKAQTVTLHVDRGIPGRFEFDASRFESSPDKPYYVGGSELSRKVLRDAIVASLAQAAGSTPASEVTATSRTVALDVATRLLALDHIVMDRVRAPGPAWVVVYLVGADGRPGSRVGIVGIPAGESAGVSVPLDRSATLTRKLLVVLQSDGGTVGVFDFDRARFVSSPDRPYAVGGAEVSAVVEVRDFGAGSGKSDGSSDGM